MGRGKDLHRFSKKRKCSPPPPPFRAYKSSSHLQRSYLQRKRGEYKGLLTHHPIRCAPRPKNERGTISEKMHTHSFPRPSSINYSRGRGEASGAITTPFSRVVRGREGVKWYLGASERKLRAEGRTNDSFLLPCNGGFITLGVLCTYGT